MIKPLLSGAFLCLKIVSITYSNNYIVKPSFSLTAITRTVNVGASQAFNFLQKSVKGCYYTDLKSPFTSKASSCKN